jgi:hypothetical protein
MAERLLLLEAAGIAAKGLPIRRKTLPNLYDTLFHRPACASLMLSLPRKTANFGNFRFPTGFVEPGAIRPETREAICDDK